MEGTTCSFTSRTPMEWELDNFPHLEVTSDTEWLPKAAHFLQDSGQPREEDQQAVVTAILAYNMQHHCSDIDPEMLARQWSIGIETTRKTLRAMMQAWIQHAIHPLHQRYQTDNMTLHHHQLHKTFYSDTLFSHIKSVHRHKCAQVTTDRHFTHVFPMNAKSSAEDMLMHFVQEVGIPDTVVVDNAG